MCVLAPLKSNCELLLGLRLRDFLRHTFEVNSSGLYTVPARDQRANAVATNKADQQQRPSGCCNKLHDGLPHLLKRVPQLYV